MWRSRDSIYSNEFHTFIVPAPNQMINFFRKIRRKFADNNQFFKYSRYAIGEIVLVVVGILIAISINNWNEQVKENKIEHKYLERLVMDLAVDSSYYEQKIERIYP